MTTIVNLDADLESMDSQVGRRVHHLMWDRRITQAQLGSVLGTTQSTVAKKLRGHRSWGLDELAMTANYLGVSMAYLLGEDLTPPAPSRPNARPSDYMGEVFPMNEYRSFRRVTPVPFLVA